MKKFTKGAAIYLILAVLGLMFAVYSLKLRNHILLAAAILFAAVSTDNVFCNLKNKN